MLHKKFVLFMRFPSRLILFTATYREVSQQVFKSILCFTVWPKLFPTFDKTFLLFLEFFTIRYFDVELRLFSFFLCHKLFFLQWTVSVSVFHSNVSTSWLSVLKRQLIEIIKTLQPSQATSEVQEIYWLKRFYQFHSCVHVSHVITNAL